MDILSLVIALVVVGGGIYILDRIQIDGTIKMIIKVILIVVLVVWLLRTFGPMLIP